MALTDIPLDDHRDSEHRAPTMSERFWNFAVGAAALIGAVYLIGNCMKKDLDDYRQCEYRVRSGDNIESIMAKEGLEGSKLREAVQYVCGENKDRMMPDGRYPQPVFYIGEAPDADCSNMMSGGIIIVPDVNDDGQINGHQCRPARY